MGAYAESIVRGIVRDNVAPLRVSTGGVVSFDLCSGSEPVPQIGTIVWHPTPLPAIFESGDFALVDVNSCLGVIEIKRSMYTGSGEKMKKVLDGEDELTCSLPDMQLYGGNALGVVCLQERGQRDATIDELVERKRAVVILRQRGI